MTDGVGHEHDPDQELGPVVRPYALTGGRTRPVLSSLRVETLVSATSLGMAALGMLAFERQRIVGLCRGLLSVAEVAAKLGLPLGVVRVLIGDLAAEGLLVVHQPASPSDRPDLALLERVLYGLREV
jgi:Protein of unknown function (DUF742)